jgi:hypothetical protein
VSKNLIILISAVVFAGTITPRAIAATSKRSGLLTDGFVLAGVDGKLISADSNEGHGSRLVGSGEPDGWLFKLDSELSDDKGLIKAGSAVEVLPSVTLEKMAIDVKERSAGGYRLWGRVTQYRGKNFIFPEYFLPLSKVQEPQSQTEEQSQQTTGGPTINEPNDALTVPKEIIARLQTRRIIPAEQPSKQPASGVELTQDFILVDRTAVFVEQAAGYGLATLDALGRNTGRFSLRLLPCQTLEWAQRQQAAEPEQLRFKIAGRVTKYKGEYYLLLQRAIQVYSHGNF